MPVPTVSSVCVLPNGGPNSGYEKGNCVGGINPPAVTCNNLGKEFSSGNAFKLYSDKDSGKCPSYGKTSVPQACKEACLAQYNACLGTYPSSCSEGYEKGKGKCQNQYADCLKINKEADGEGRCDGYGKGWEKDEKDDKKDDKKDEKDDKKDDKKDEKDDKKDDKKDDGKGNGKD